MRGRTTAFVVARLGSTRLRRKALLPVLGEPMIARMIERVRRAALVDEIVIATTTLPEDGELVNLATALGCRAFRGSPDNVSRRMADAAAACGAESIVELLADNPLVHADLIDDVIRAYREADAEYAASITNEYAHLPSDMKRFPIGIRVQVYSREAADRWTDFPEFLDKGLGTTAFMFNSADAFKCSYVEAHGSWSAVHHPDYHLAVNYHKNYELICAIFEALYPADANFSLPAVAGWLAANPRLHRMMGS